VHMQHLVTVNRMGTPPHFSLSHTQHNNLGHVAGWSVRPMMGMCKGGGRDTTEYNTQVINNNDDRIKTSRSCPHSCPFKVVRVDPSLEVSSGVSTYFRIRNTVGDARNAGMQSELLLPG
jgi:hypothetical protein